jgi:hypothetical protein
MNHHIPVTLLTVTAGSFVLASASLAQSPASVVDQTVLLDIAVAACSNRLSLNGFRFNRAQENWRRELLARGPAAQEDYRLAHDKAMAEVLHVMSGQDSRACPYAYLKVKDAFGSEMPLLQLRDGT